MAFVASLSTLHKTFPKIFSVCFSATEEMTVLGIESSCDDTGVGVVTSSRRVLGHAAHSQLSVHLKTGGVVPTTAGQLHREHLHRVTHLALDEAGLQLKDISVVAVTVGPGLAPCLRAGLEFAKDLVRSERKPLLGVHHMEAHALTARLLCPLSFPQLVLLVSGGHCILVVAECPGQFYRLGESHDDSPGEALDKVARSLRLHAHPDCTGLSGGAAIERIASQGDPTRYSFPKVMWTRRDCKFSFSGLKTATNRIILEIDSAENGDSKMPVAHCQDIAASFQKALFHHILARTHRAILFSCARWPDIKHLVVSGGVASNMLLRAALKKLVQVYGLELHCPPPYLCTDNGIMIAWAGIERLLAGDVPANDPDSLEFRPRWPLGIDMSAAVAGASLKLPKELTLLDT